MFAPPNQQTTAIVVLRRVAVDGLISHILYISRGKHVIMDRNMIDTASGGALMDKTPAATRHLILNIASNMQRFEIRGRVDTSKVVSEVIGSFLVIFTRIKSTKANYSIVNLRSNSLKDIVCSIMT
ncbi:hypothetical protein CR513_43576, partial [Mucuna pruriens]